MKQANPITEKTKQVIGDLLNSRLSHRELAEELNQRRQYMLSGASWNASRIKLFVAKNQITATPSAFK